MLYLINHVGSPKEDGKYIFELAPNSRIIEATVLGDMILFDGEIIWKPMALILHPYDRWEKKGLCNGYVKASQL